MCRIEFCLKRWQLLGWCSTPLGFPYRIFYTIIPYHLSLSRDARPAIENGADTFRCPGFLDKFFSSLCTVSNLAESPNGRFSPYLSPWCWLSFVYLLSCFGGDPEIIRTAMGYFFLFDVQILNVVGLLL